jgi:hypothetical protein
MKIENSMWKNPEEIVYEQISFPIMMILLLEISRAYRSASLTIVNEGRRMEVGDERERDLT